MAVESVKLINEDVESGGKETDANDIEHDFTYNNNVHNATINIRLGSFERYMVYWAFNF